MPYTNYDLQQVYESNDFYEQRHRPYRRRRRRHPHFSRCRWERECGWDGCRWERRCDLGDDFYTM
ncbi:hypothetical protein BK704_19585 [[Bacillus thuringiensis] serovar konkukian]|nr:hypothetical protein [Bacillus thuringiensis]MED1305358.1 hypothetical protein [Bacillus pacificus]OUB04287.1 hypothetical protein BK704_19585 [[Bacillus thuringiensis] serovar konkukian]